MTRIEANYANEKMWCGLDDGTRGDAMDECLKSSQLNQGFFIRDIRRHSRNSRSLASRASGPQRERRTL